MRQIRIFILLFFFIKVVSGVSQTPTKGSISGKVVDENGEPMIGASVSVENLKIGTTTDVSGKFNLTEIQEGIHTLTIAYITYTPVNQRVIVKAGEESRIATITLKPADTQIEEVIIIGKSKTRQIHEQSFNVTAIDAKPLHNSTKDINQVLNKTAGIRVREDGGLGSGFNFSLHGFSGRQVKFFLDGIPMDNFGSSLSLNNIPVNMAERIEIYKGVVPVWLGADALGGAVNIVTRQNIRNFLDISYSFGSFNTHRSSINAGYIHPKTGFTVLANVFQNYSDNSYWVNVQIPDARGKYGPMQRVRRFHDAYRSETVQLETGISNKKYADKLLLGLILSGNKKEIQTGASMERVYGARQRNSHTFMPTLKYKKDNLFLKGLNLSLYGTYNFGSNQIVDTTARTYNWSGGYKDNADPTSGEESRSLFKFSDNLKLSTANLSYKWNDSHSFALNYVYSSFNRKGHDPVRPNEEVYKRPQILNKHVIGLGYKFDFRKRWSTSVFAKQFIMQAQTSKRVDIYTSNARYINITNDFTRTGFGIATSYFLTTGLQVKTSFENTCRLPEGEEIFGNGVNQVSNPDLQPERSKNFNLGFIWDKSIKEKHRLNIEGGFILRNAIGFIRQELVGPNLKSINQAKVRATGIESDIKYTYDKRYHLGFNTTYQYIVNTWEYETPALYMAQLPNIPYFFCNGEAGIAIPNFGYAHARLSLHYNLSYVKDYYLYWPKMGGQNSKYDIPSQLTHNVSASYSIKDGRYNLSLECVNLSNARVYDNFMLQKPGRAFYIKVRYFISK